MSDYEVEHFDCPEFEAKLKEAIEAPLCEPCDGEECEYAPLCRLIKGWADK